MLPFRFFIHDAKLPKNNAPPLEDAIPILMGRFKKLERVTTMSMTL